MQICIVLCTGSGCNHIRSLCERNTSYACTTNTEQPVYNDIQLLTLVCNLFLWFTGMCEDLTIVSQLYITVKGLNTTDLMHDKDTEHYPLALHISICTLLPVFIGK